jgi:hypothetical protein
VLGIIPNFGHFWRRSYIDWGGPGRKGHLRGYSGRKEVDFRDQIAVYVLYDKNFVPVYVGQAGTGWTRRLFDRLRDHDADHVAISWDYFSCFGFLRVGRNGRLEKSFPRRRKINFSAARDHIEGLVITAIGPRLNRQGPKWNATNWRHGEYFQYEDPKLDSLSEMNREELPRLLKELKSSSDRSSRSRLR